MNKKNEKTPSSSPSCTTDLEHDMLLSQEQQNFLETRKMNEIRIRLVQISIFVLFLCLWQFCSYKEIINPFIFSSPERIFLCFCQMVVDKSIFRHIGLTLMETFFSFFLVFVISIGVSVLLWWNQTLSKILEPYLIILNSLPKSALAPLLLVWFGATLKMILITAVSVVIFGSILNIYTGFMETDVDKLMLIRTLRGNKWHCLKLVVIPGSIPILFGVMKSNIGLCLVGVIIAEFIGAKAGLGYLIIYSSQVFKLDWLLMAVILLCLIAMALYAILGKLEKWVLSGQLF
jgi:NitT/TauT family transport system permease protein